MIDDDGATGIGFCYAGSDGGSLPSVAVRDLFSDVLVSEDSDRTTGLWDAMYHKALLHGRTGSVMRALSAIDIALWDLKARRASRPLWKHLGAHAAAAVPAYASGGYYLDGKTAADLGHEVQRYVDAGYRAVKIKVGFVPPEIDAARIAVARDVLGPERLLMLDANNAWRDVPTALRALRMWEPFDPYWIEEPFSPDDITNHAALAAKTPIVVATGEIEAGRWRHFELLRRNAASILQTDAAVCGGITEFMRISHLADGFGVTMAPHWFHDLHAHLVASISNGSWVEVFPGSDVLNFGELIDRRVEVRESEVVLSNDPGIGFDFDEDGVERFATEPWS